MKFPITTSAMSHPQNTYICALLAATSIPFTIVLLLTTPHYLPHHRSSKPCAETFRLSAVRKKKAWTKKGKRGKREKGKKAKRQTKTKPRFRSCNFLHPAFSFLYATFHQHPVARQLPHPRYSFLISRTRRRIVLRASPGPRPRTFSLSHTQDFYTHLSSFDADSFPLFSTTDTDSSTYAQVLATPRL